MSIRGKQEKKKKRKINDVLDTFMLFVQKNIRCLSAVEVTLFLLLIIIINVEKAVDK
jgi:hypothetical protein